MASGSRKLLARAFERAVARQRVLNPGCEPAFDVVLAEALVEVQVALDLRDEKDRRKWRKSARRLYESAEIRARIPSIAAAAETPPGPELAESQGSPHGPPPWHPEHRSFHSDN